MASISRGMVTIGVDPHSTSHMLVAMDQVGRHLGELRVAACEDGYERALVWAKRFGVRCWAVEGVGVPFARSFGTRLLAAGELVYNVPPAMTSQYRSKRGRKKNDEIDASNAARALMAHPELTPWNPLPYDRELKTLSRTYRRLSEELRAIRMSMRTCTIPQAREAMEGVASALEEGTTKLKAQMHAVVRELAPELLSVRGVGPVVACTVLAEVGDIRRFADRDRFASYAGAAPMPWSTGDTRRPVFIVNPRGNRALNHVLHIIVMNRARVDERTKDYVERRRAMGNTNREIWRLLKTYVAREIYRLMRGMAAHPLAA